MHVPAGTAAGPLIAPLVELAAEQLAQHVVAATAARTEQGSDLLCSAAAATGIHRLNDTDSAGVLAAGTDKFALAIVANVAGTCVHFASDLLKHALSGSLPNAIAIARAARPSAGCSCPSSSARRPLTKRPRARLLSRQFAGKKSRRYGRRHEGEPFHRRILAAR